MNLAVLTAVKSRLGDPRWTVLDMRSMVPAARPPAVLVETPSLLRTTDRFGGGDVQSDGTVQTSGLAVSAEQAAWLQDRIDALLVGYTLTVTGGRSWRLEQYTAPRLVGPIEGMPEGSLYEVATLWAVHVDPTQ